MAGTGKQMAATRDDQASAGQQRRTKRRRKFIAVFLIVLAMVGTTVGLLRTSGPGQQPPIASLFPRFQAEARAGLRVPTQGANPNPRSENGVHLTIIHSLTDGRRQAQPVRSSTTRPDP